MKKLVLISTLLLSMGSAQAAESLNWNKVEGSYHKLDADGDDLSGFGVAGTVDLNNNFLVDVSYKKSSDDITEYGESLDVDYTVLSAGIGYKLSISETTDAFGVLSYEEVKVDVSYQGYSEDISGDGYGAKLGIRSMLFEQFELTGSIQYVKIEDENETGLELSGLYHFSQKFAAGFAYNSIGDMDTTSIKAVYFF